MNALQTRVWAALTAALLAGSCHGARMQPSARPSGGVVVKPKVKIETTLGDMILELDAEKAPRTVVNFIRYARDKFYGGTVFHRVVKDFMIQAGGLPPDMDKSKKDKDLRDPIRNEWENGLKHARGTIAMVRNGGRPDSATSQFFINVVDNFKLDIPQRDGAGYAVFGKVVEGMDTVEKIRTTPVSTHPKYRRGTLAVVPVEPVIIKSVRVVSAFDPSKFDDVIARADEAIDAEKRAKVAEFTKKLDEVRAKGVKTESGLIYYDTVVGTGPAPMPTERVVVHYTGWLTDGTKFDSSVDRDLPFDFSLSGGDIIIKGWPEGVATMKVGGKRTLIIPSELGYGNRKAGTKIPPNSTLVYDIELLSIE